MGLMFKVRRIDLRAGLGDLACQLNMGVLKRFSAAVQDGHQIDHHILVLNQGLEHFFIVHIGLHHVHKGQRLNASGGQSTRRYGDTVLKTVQGFTQVVPHKAGTTENEYFFHEIFEMSGQEEKRTIK